MARHCTLAALALGLTAILAACDQGVRIGSWQMIQPKGTLNVSRIEVTRRQASVASPAATRPGAGMAQPQKLSIDLVTGRTAFTDSDGRTHPWQLSAADVDQLRHALADRVWIQHRSSAAKSATVGAHYVLTAFDEGKPLDRQVQWTDVPAKPLPPVLSLVETLFARAERNVHPLGESINLLK